MRKPGVVMVAVLAAAVAFSACGGDDDAAPSTGKPDTSADTTTSTTSPPTTTVPPPPSVATLEGVSVGLEPVNDTIEKATAITWKDGDSAAYVTTQTGYVYRLESGNATVVLDLSEEVPVYESGSEQGLLGIAFDPRDGRVFVHFNDHNGDTHIVSYTNEGGSIDTVSRREVLFQDQPGLGHKGGQLVFDGDGNLYIALGDGGGSRGRDAQDMTKLLGAIVRITPMLHAEGYDIPADNPFVHTPDVRAELWAKGLRNPWKFSIDARTGDMWIGDVGESDVEEVDVMPAGQKGLNFGWYFFEGTRALQPDPPAGLTGPAHEYPHTTGIAVIGGYVSRGVAIPGLSGAYVFGDVNGSVWAKGSDGVVKLPIQVGGTLSGFGQAPDGELYALSLSKGVFKIVPA